MDQRVTDRSRIPSSPTGFAPPASLSPEGEGSERLSRRHAQDLLDFIDASPSPWHAVDTGVRRLGKAGFLLLEETEAWSLEPGGRYAVVRGGSSLIAFRVGTTSPVTSGFRIVGAHTDSPGLRLKPKPAQAGGGLLRLGVEIYGGPILATFADRDLSVAGRVCFRDGERIAACLLRFEQPLLRLPNLAIHMNRAVNEEGLKLNKQIELPLFLEGIADGVEPERRFLEFLADRAGCGAGDILSFDLNLYDTQNGAFWGANEEFIAASRIDNLSSCHAGISALLESDTGEHTIVAALFDHEEIGSESHRGADGSFLADVLERIAAAAGADAAEYRQALARSFLVSADAAHAYHPNFPNAYEPLHAVRVNGGPAVKINASQRYATDSLTEARFLRLCEEALVPCQKYVHRTDLACGSTIGPMTAARLGIATVDCGCPMWAMHSIRESAGVFDQSWFAAVLRTFFGADRLP